MRQHHDPEPYEQDEEDLEELGTPLYQGTGLSVRALTTEELQRFLDAHQGQPAELLGSGWAALDPLGHPLGGPRTPPVATLPALPAEVTGSLGSPGRSALAAYRRRRATELAAWTRSLAWRAPLVAAAGLTVQVLTIQAGLPHGGLVGLALAALVGWRLRFRVSEQAAPGSAAPTASGAPPACWSGSPPTATWCSTTWPCLARPPMWIIW